MRTHGTLTKWNDDRGFGFITPAKGPPEIFVHISEFPRQGGRPALHELVSFEVLDGPDGKKRAVPVMRPGRKGTRLPANSARQRAQSSWLSSALVFVLVAGIGLYAYAQFTQRRAESRLATMEAVQPASPSSCDGRSMCSEMRSCKEATYFIQNCPGTKMDGDNDGVPCEQQLCN